MMFGPPIGRIIPSVKCIDAGNAAGTVDPKTNPNLFRNAYGLQLHDGWDGINPILLMLSIWLVFAWRILDIGVPT
jgi:hypothetical protein